MSELLLYHIRLCNIRLLTLISCFVHATVQIFIFILRFWNFKNKIGQLLVAYHHAYN